MNLGRVWKCHNFASTAFFILSASTAWNCGPAWADTQAEILRNCETCHGAHGNSTVSTTPRLNGQQQQYIVERLKTLSRATRSPHANIPMSAGIRGLGDPDILSIARYFSRQTPTSPAADAKAEAGALIFEKGSKEDNVIGCSQCHGAQGEGHDATPRISGQHADYLKAQLRLFNLKFRDHVLMTRNTKTMSDSTLNKLVAYLASD